MGFSLYNVFKAGLLVGNAVAILHPRRFLAKYNLDKIDPNLPQTSVQNQAVGLLQAVSYLKAPLVIINILIILVEVLIGG